MLIRKWLNDTIGRKDIVITIPCDSTDAWILAAYQNCIDAEAVENPWENVIARKKITMKSEYLEIKREPQYIMNYCLRFVRNGKLY